MRPNILDPLNPRSEGFGERLQQGSQNLEQDFQKHYNDVLDKYSSIPINSRISENIAGGYLQGPPLPQSTNITDLVRSSNDWGQDPYAYSKPISFGAGERDQNFQRYYNHPSFKKLGFIPGRNNEAVYNENSGWMSDFQRAIPQIMSLAGSGFKDMLSEWTDYGFNPDTKMGEKMEHAMSIGNSSRGGLGGWFTNFAVNSGYTMGIMADLAAEEFALAGLTYLTGGLAASATGPLAAERLVKGADMLGKVGSMGRATKAWADAFRIIRTPEAASKFYQAAKATGKFFNPLERTLEFGQEFNKLGNMKWYAKASRGAMALFGDIRMMNAVASESKLESGMAKTDKNKDLVNFFYYGDETTPGHNRMPNEEEALAIDKQASDAARFTAMSNVPLIYLSNKVVFDGVFKGSRILRETPANAAIREMEGATKQVFVSNALKKAPAEFVKQYSVKGFKEIMKPGRLIKGSLKYTSKNLVEGLQENAQDVIHDTAMDYYQNFYKDPMLASMKSSLGRGLLNMVSAQGLDTFLSGFLMGGAIGAVSTPLFETLPRLGKQIFIPKAYGKWKAEKDQFVTNFTKTYNAIKNNPGKYTDAFNDTDENYVVQQILNDHSVNIADPKTSMDVKDESAFHHVYSLLKNNQLSFLRDLISDYKQMSPTQLKEAFGGEEGPDATGLNIYQRLENFEKKLGIVESIYKDHVKTHPNPVTAEQALKSPEGFKLYSEFEMYRKLAVFAHYSFERAADRSTSILEKASVDKPIANAMSTDFTVLYSPKDLNQKIESLKQEISLLKGVPNTETKASLESKEKKIEILRKYRDHLADLTKELKKKDQNPQAVESYNQSLFNAYHEYLKVIADDYNEPLLDSRAYDTFVSIKDFAAINSEHLDFARAVNMFASPEYVEQLLEQLGSVRTKLESQQVDLAKQGLETAIDRIKTNALLNKLFEIGVYLAKDDPFLSDQTKLPSRFYHADDYTLVDPSEDTYQEAAEIVRLWAEQTTDLPDVVDDSKLSPILPQFHGKVVFMTAGIGKTTIVAKYPDELVDGDDILFSILQKHNIPFTTSQKAGLDLSKYISDHPEEAEGLIKEFQTKARAEADKGKTVLTASKYLIPIADMAFISDDVPHIASVFKARGQVYAGSAASGHVTRSEEAFPNAEHVPSGIFAEHILTGIAPAPPIDAEYEAVLEKLSKADTLTKLEATKEDLYKMIADKKISSDAARELYQARKKQLVTDVSFERIKKGDILIMTDTKIFGTKGYGQVTKVSADSITVRKWWPGIEPGIATESKTITPSTVHAEVSLIYDDAMTNADVTPVIDPGSNAVAKDNKDSDPDVDNMIKDRLNGKKPDTDINNKPDC